MGCPTGPAHAPRPPASVPPRLALEMILCQAPFKDQLLPLFFWLCFSLVLVPKPPDTLSPCMLKTQALSLILLHLFSSLVSPILDSVDRVVSWTLSFDVLLQSFTFVFFSSLFLMNTVAAGNIYLAF